MSFHHRIESGRMKANHTIYTPKGLGVSDDQISILKLAFGKELECDKVNDTNALDCLALPFIGEIYKGEIQCQITQRD
jgi:hypothetical protein